MPSHDRQRHHIVTDDGCRLTLHHIPARGVARRRWPVICCHGLAANHLAFNVGGEGSLAHHLASHGYEVHLLDLRGHGASERRRFGWTFDDYVHLDMPAALDKIGPAHWIGHSMGGILALAYLAQGGESLVSATTVGSSLDYSGSGSGFHRLAGLSGLLTVLPAVPVAGLARISAALVGRVANPFERFNVWTTNTDPALFRRICKRGFHPVSPPVMMQLGTAMQPGGLRSLSGEPYLDGLARVTTPVFALAGSRDAQCPPEAVEQTVAALGGAKAVRTFGADHGERDHYGHFDLLIGRRAKQEVFPHIDRWLDAHDDSRAA